MDYIGMLTFIKDGKKDCEIYKESDIDDDLVIESIYQEADQKVSDGYTVVINLKGPFPNEKNVYGFSQSEILVPENIKPQDYILIMDKVKYDFKTIEIMDITNYCHRNGYLDYDYYDYKLNMHKLTNDMDSAQRYYCQRDNEERTPDKIVDVFLRKKLDGLTKKEEQMYQTYEDFNIEKILYDDNTKFALNNGNSGVITIFEDKTYQSTVTKMAHIDENKQHINAYIDLTEKMEEPDNIYIQLTNGYIACWLPTEINEYQKSQLNEFFNEVEDMQMLRGNVEVFGAVREGNEISDIREEFNGIDSIKQYLNQSKSKK